METRFGVKGTVCDGVFFTESALTGAAVVRHLRVEISRQNANLFQLKKRMAGEAQRVGANAIMNFRYGQRAHRGLKLLALKWDTESWHGEGEAVNAADA